MYDFLYRLLRRVVKRTDLPDESDWDKMRSSDFAVDELLNIPEFMEQTEFRAEALKVAKSRIDVAQDRGKKVETDVLAHIVIGETFNPFIDQGR